MKRNHLRIVISRHAFRRAMQRSIHPDLVFEALKLGKMQSFGRNRARIEKEFRKFSLVCVGEIRGNRLKIVTVGKKVKK